MISCKEAIKKLDEIKELLSCFCEGTCQVENGKVVSQAEKRKIRELKNYAQGDDKAVDDECEGGVCSVPKEYDE